MTETQEFIARLLEEESKWADPNSWMEEYNIPPSDASTLAQSWGFCLEMTRKRAGLVEVEITTDSFAALKNEYLKSKDRMI